MKNKTALFMLSVILCLPTLCHSALIQYNDKDLFINSTLAESIGELPNSGGHGTTVGPVTFLNGPGASIAFTELATVITGQELAASGNENYNLNIDGGAYAFGFDAYEPTGRSMRDGCNSTCFDTTFELTIFNGATELGKISFNLHDDVLDFVGISSDILFNRIEIRDITGTDDNEFFGNMLITRQQLASVPLPPTVLLFLSGLLVLLLRKKTRLSQLSH
ncbi:hypothetical protein [Thalassomonas sp. RHCl1]|uniref:hypothetical protein n=1 Tax=Thalassomonas sp. RHCl1 TaxID=2995320 RepID=UPI00248A92C0|nr:hypothetical protein [Thalassomonas sp. RHCl1]